MGYPNPMTVRAVRETLEEGLREAGMSTVTKFLKDKGKMAGAPAVVQSVLGTFWGKLFTRSNDREYLNFLGELAKRTLPGEQVKIASRIQSYERIKYNPNEQKWNISVPAGNNQTWADRARGGRQDSVPMTRRNADSFIQSQYRFSNSNQGNKPSQNNNNNEGGGHKNFSVLLDAVDEMCMTGYDFSISTFFGKIRQKLSFLFDRKDKETGKDVLYACYQFLEDHGYEAYPIMLDIMNNLAAQDFSETVDRYLESARVDSSEMDEVFRAFAKLTPSEQDALLNALQVSVGNESTDLFINSISERASGKKSTFLSGLLKHLGITVIALAIMNTLFAKRAEKNREKYS